MIETGIERVYEDLFFFEIPYVNGKIHGTKKRYYSNSALAQEITYVNGKKHGVSRGYHFDGSLMDESHFVNDKRKGILKYYWLGNLNRIITKNGEENNGIFIYFNFYIF